MNKTLQSLAKEVHLALDLSVVNSSKGDIQLKDIDGNVLTSGTPEQMEPELQNLIRYAEGRKSAHRPSFL